VKRITAIQVGKGQPRRVKIFLNGKFAFSLADEIATKERLQTNQVLSTEQIETLSGADCYQRCLYAADRYLSYRPRSESELRERLSKRDFDIKIIEDVIIKLKEKGLVNDTSFAQFWKDNRESFNPRSRWLTKLELRRKGIADDIIDQTLGSIDDDDSAYRAALRKAGSLSRSDYQSFRRRLGEYLKRRGFGNGVIIPTIERVWQEQINS